MRCRYFRRHSRYIFLASVYKNFRDSDLLNILIILLIALAISLSGGFCLLDDLRNPAVSRSINSSLLVLLSPSGALEGCNDSIPRGPIPLHPNPMDLVMHLGLSSLCRTFHPHCHDGLLLIHPPRLLCQIVFQGVDSTNQDKLVPSGVNNTIMFGVLLYQLLPKRGSLSTSQILYNRKIVIKGHMKLWRDVSRS